MKRIITTVLLLFVIGIYQEIFAQGCVAIKGTAGVCSRPGDATGWELNLNTRYFKSYKHFVGTIEQKQREEEGTNVINHSGELDVTATRYLNLRWSLAVTLPIMDFARSSLYEHDGSTRHSTHSFGI